ncbi:MAG: methyltransferase domain-containing protein [Ornithinimicrobium sp.]|uniref:methyltransferase domain-containing protein n=1 Tax=Ornithinimicrobium sp. TaxID=1977084 RepID=UPI003D9BA57F
MTDISFTQLFSQALQGNLCHIVGIEDRPVPLPVEEWTRDADEADHALLGLCRGRTLDIGCGPGRLTLALSAHGEEVLGIDIVREAVSMTRSRGGAAMLRDVFDPRLGDGRWGTALLADGNIGIGGDPIGLLRRAGELITPGGRVVVEVQPPGAALRTMWATLQCGDAISRPFRWSIVGVDDIGGVAAQAGLVLTRKEPVGSRWGVVLQHG